MVSENGITDMEIEKFFDDATNEDLKKNFMSLYSSDSITKYIYFYNIITEKRAKYPFAIFTTDKENKPGTHWWSGLDIHPKKDLLLLDSIGFIRFKQFIVDNNKNIISSPAWVEKIKKTKNKDNCFVGWLAPGAHDRHVSNILIIFF